MSWSTQDVRVDGTSIMSRKFWISDRGGLDMTPGFRSTNFDVAYLQGTMWRPKQIPEVVRSIAMVVDGCDENGIYPAGDSTARIAQMNANRMELLALFARENTQVTIERDVLIPDGSGGSTVQTWTGYAQATTSIVPANPEDFDEYQTLSIDLLFADPVWYGDEQVEVVSGSATITNDGDIDATNLLLEFTGGADYRLTNQSTLPEDTWVEVDRSGTLAVDVRAGTAIKDPDINVIGYLSHDGSRQFMRLVPGDNDLVLTGGGSCTITYRVPRA